MTESTVKSSIHTALRSTLQKLEATSARLQQIDSCLKEIDYFLNDLQPPASGKIRITFEERDGRNPTPRAYVWYKVKGHGDLRWTAKPVPVQNLKQRAKRRGDFYHNSQLVKELLSIVSDLVRERANLVMAAQSFRARTSLDENKRMRLEFRYAIIFNQINDVELNIQHFGRRDLETDLWRTYKEPRHPKAEQVEEDNTQG